MYNNFYTFSTIFIPSLAIHSIETTPSFSRMCIKDTLNVINIYFSFFLCTTFKRRTVNKLEKNYNESEVTMLL